MRRVTLKGLAARKLRLVLTAISIVLGVTFITGTLVLGDTLNRTFDTLVGTVYQHVSFEIRGNAELSGSNNQGPDSTTARRPVPASIGAAVRRLPGVEVAEGSVEGYAQFVSRTGENPLGNSSAGFSFDPYPKLASFRLVKGHAPAGSDQVLMDTATAQKNHFAIGDRVQVLLPHGTRYFTISGLTKFGADNSLPGISIVQFSLPVAQQLFGLVGRYDTINVLTKPGADNVAVERAIKALLPPGVQVVSGQQISNELDNTISSALSFLSTALLIFGVIALIVGAFTIYNTFSITVGQRTRELALLRVVGASRRQVFSSVLQEAAITGLVGSVIGLGLGVAAALGLRALLSAFGISLPSAPLVFEARTPIVALIVGIGVTVLSAIVPARRAVRIPPVAALVAHNEERADVIPRARVIAGVVVALFSALLTILGLTGPRIALVGLGAAVMLIAAAMLIPVIAGPVAHAIGGPLARIFGTPGRIGRRNATRSPRRTAQTSAALMIGLMLVSLIAVLGTSLSASTKQQIDSAIRAGYVVTGSVPTSAPGVVKALPGVTAETLVYQGQIEYDGSVQTLGAVTLPGLDKTVNLSVTSGQQAAALAAGQLLVDTNTARSDHLHIGSVVHVTFAETGPTTMVVGGIFTVNPAVGSFVTGAPFFLAHFHQPLAGGLLISTAPGTQHFERLLTRVLYTDASLDVQSRSQYEASSQKSVETLLDLVYVLLALAVVIALIGIVNTLILSVFERTHEIGLMRAVGMRRPQVKAMIRAEAIIIALFGAVVGIVLGTAFGAALADALRNDSVTTVAVPVVSLIAFFVFAGLLGLYAASWPARRAAKLDVLSAIAAD